MRLTFILFLTFLLMPNHVLATSIIAPDSLEAKKIIKILTPELTRKISYENIENFTKEAQPYLRKFNDKIPQKLMLIANYSSTFIDVNKDGIKEFIFWSEGMAENSWSRPREFIAVAQKDKNDRWQISAFNYLSTGKDEHSSQPSLKCQKELAPTTPSCRFSYSRLFTKIGSANEFIGLYLNYAIYGTSGHSYVSKIIRYNRYEDKIEINTITAPLPLIPDMGYGK